MIYFLFDNSLCLIHHVFNSKAKLLKENTIRSGSAKVVDGDCIAV